MSIRIHHIENAPPALLDYMIYGGVIGIVIAFVIVFYFSRKPRPNQKNSIQRASRCKRNVK